jgi:hypothetical protein
MSDHLRVNDPVQPGATKTLIADANQSLLASKLLRDEPLRVEVVAWLRDARGELSRIEEDFAIDDQLLFTAKKNYSERPARLRATVPGLRGDEGKNPSAMRPLQAHIRQFLHRRKGCVPMGGFISKASFWSPSSCLPNRMMPP